MTDTIKVNKVQIIEGIGGDTILFEVDLPNGCYPFKGDADLKMVVAQGSAVAYLQKNFPTLKPNVVKR